jgi:hypothetical protein
MAPGSALNDLAESVRGLPIESLAPAGVLVLGGLLLLAFGRKLLKPVLVVAAIFGGVVVAVRIGHAFAPSMSPFLFASAGALAGVLAVMLFYRVALAIALGAIGAVAAMLIATTAAEFGFVDVGPQPDAAEVAPVAPLADRVPMGLSDGERALVGERIDGVAPGLGPAVLDWLDRASRLLTEVGLWIEGRWDTMPRPMRTLLLASAAAGGFFGFVAGIASPAFAAAAVTSLFGSLLVLFCGLPILSRFAAADPLASAPPVAWLATWLGLALAGWVFQWTTRSKPKAKREPEE